MLNFLPVASHIIIDTEKKHERKQIITKIFCLQFANLDIHSLFLQPRLTMDLQRQYSILIHYHEDNVDGKVCLDCSLNYFSLLFIHNARKLLIFLKQNRCWTLGAPCCSLFCFHNLHLQRIFIIRQRRRILVKRRMNRYIISNNSRNVNKIKTYMLSSYLLFKTFSLFSSLHLSTGGRCTHCLNFSMALPLFRMSSALFLILNILREI